MDSKKEKKKNKEKFVDNKKINVDHEEYGYDFVPHLNEWINIDEQREKTKELEDI